MTRFLLDTTALIDFSKGREPISSRLLSMIEAGEEFGVCPVNVAEFYAGIPPHAVDLWREFIYALSYWHIGLGAALRAGRERYDLARRGRAVSTADLLIAAVARQESAVIITGNAKDYDLQDVELLVL